MKKIFTLIVMLAATLGMQAQDNWLITGEKTLMGSDWSNDDVNNIMTPANDGKTFVLEKKGVMLAAGEYAYKVTKQGSWDEAYPSGMDNQKLLVNENGEYTIVFTYVYDPANSIQTLDALPTKTGAYVEPEPVEVNEWTVVGVAEICGSDWNLNDANNNMVAGENGIFTWTKENVALNKGKEYGFKVVADHSWSNPNYGGAAGGQTSDNYMITVDKPGLYTVKIIFDSKNKTLSHEATWTAEHHFDEDVWTIVGDEKLTGHSWVPNDDWTIVTDNDMTKTAEGEYELVRHNVQLLFETEYEYKAACNHSWSVSIPSGMANNSYKHTEEDGLYDVTFLLLTDNKSLEAFAAVASGIESVKVLIQKSAPIYNLQGQRVDGNYRGIAIQNGRKVVVK